MILKNINDNVGELVAIKDSLVKTKQKGAILELKQRHLKNIIFCNYTPYLAMKIWRISASSPQETLNDQFPIRRITLQPYAICKAGLIKESLVKTKQKGAILELKQSHLKNIIFCYYTPYPAMKIRRISANSAHETRNDQFPIRRITLQPYAICIAGLCIILRIDICNHKPVPVSLAENPSFIPSKYVNMNDPNIIMEECIRLEEEKACRNGKVYNWETATYDKIWYDKDVHDLISVENKFPAIVFDDAFTSNALL
nr:hypothetical protein [Tanacetum cinerariifolium]